MAMHGLPHYIVDLAFLRLWQRISHQAAQRMHRVPAHNSYNYYSQAAATKTSAANTSSNIAPLSSHELRQYIHDSYAKLTSIQRQLHRGEELYYEESYHHGTLLSFGFSADVHSIIGNYIIYIHII